MSTTQIPDSPVFERLNDDIWSVRGGKPVSAELLGSSMVVYLGTRHDAEQWLRERHITPREARLYSASREPHALRGVSGPVFLVGNGFGVPVQRRADVYQAVDFINRVAPSVPPDRTIAARIAESVGAQRPEPAKPRVTSTKVRYRDLPISVRILVAAAALAAFWVFWEIATVAW